MEWKNYYWGRNEETAQVGQSVVRYTRHLDIITRTRTRALVVQIQNFVKKSKFGPNWPEGPVHQDQKTKLLSKFRWLRTVSLTKILIFDKNWNFDTNCVHVRPCIYCLLLSNKILYKMVYMGARIKGDQLWSGTGRAIIFWCLED